MSLCAAGYGPSRQNLPSAALGPRAVVGSGRTRTSRSV
jgi:hypothetical protein